MNGLNIGQLMITVVAVALLMTPLFVLVFLAGLKSATSSAHRQFERMHPDFVLPPGSWRAEFDGIDSDEQQVFNLELQQVGSRIVGTGRSQDGTKHSLEGILYQRRMCCVCIDENRDGTWLGTMTAELLPGDQQMTGMRSRWSARTQTLIVRKATFTRAVVPGHIADPVRSA